VVVRHLGPGNAARGVAGASFFSGWTKVQYRRAGHRPIVRLLLRTRASPGRSLIEKTRDADTNATPRTRTFFGKMLRVAMWGGAGLAALVIAFTVISVVWLAAGIPDNQRVKNEMGEFCSLFSQGRPTQAIEIVARAKEHGYDSRVDRRNEESAVMSYARARTGTRWSCIVVLRDGRVREAQVRGRGLGD
jgi:hypothetical protein